MDPDSTAPEEMVVLAVVEDIRWEPVPVRPVETTVERVRRTALHTTEAVAEVLGLQAEAEPVVVSVDLVCLMTYRGLL